MLKASLTRSSAEVTTVHYTSSHTAVLALTLPLNASAFLC